MILMLVTSTMVRLRNRLDFVDFLFRLRGSHVSAHFSVVGDCTSTRVKKNLLEE